jgi:hypothetical protein
MAVCRQLLGAYAFHFGVFSMNDIFLFCQPMQLCAVLGQKLAISEDNDIGLFLKKLSARTLIGSSQLF